MKMLITLLSVCLLAASPHSRADVRLPKSTFTTDRMEEALKTAKEQKKPVAYLYTNTATTCPLAAGVTVLAAALIVPALPWLLGFAAGAMLYVVAAELLPTRGDPGPGALAFAAGFTVMMILDVALG